jgi:replicative DNA helicase
MNWVASLNHRFTDFQQITMAKNQRKNYKDRNETVLETDGRIPPQAVEIEEAVLGGMLIDRDAALMGMESLKVTDFYKPVHQHIFEAMTDLIQGKNNLDILTLENELRDRGYLDLCGGPGYLSQLTRSVSSSANIEYHIQIISEKALKRDLILSCTEVIKESYDPASDPYDVLDMAERKVFELSNNNSRGAVSPITDTIKSTLVYLEELRSKKSAITGVPTNLDVDKMTAGWQRGDLVIIAARPSMGKTAFILTVARNAALHPDPEKRTPIALFSLEMSNQSLVQRLLTMEARVDAQKARTGQLNDEEFKQLIDAAGRLYPAPIYVDDTPGISLMEVRSKCRRLKSEKNIGLVVIDYLQLMTASVKDNANREQEIAFISRGLKGLAKELDLPVIALAQLSRAVEQRGRDKRPQLSDLRESGSIEQDADVVCFLYRPEYYGITTTDEGESTFGIAEVIIGKQRNGPTGTVSLHFVKEYARFENLTSAKYSDDYASKDYGRDAFMPDDIEGYDSKPAGPSKGFGPAISDDESPF